MNERNDTNPDEDTAGSIAGAHADRPPTPEEEKMAEKVSQDVDVERVAEHAEEAMDLGANVRGEGAIEP